MTYGRRTPRWSRVDAPMLWTGGLVTAVVAALIAAMGAGLAGVAFDAQVLVPDAADLLGQAPVSRLANFAAGAAVAATALAYILLLTVPRPVAALSWVVGSASAIGALWPYGTTAAPASQTATAVVNLCVGAVIGFLVTRVATQAGPASEPPDITPRSTY